MFAQAAPVSPMQGLGSQMWFFIPLMVIFYFLLIRPQQKRAKELAKLLETLKTGDEVVTASGIVGTIITVKEKTVTLRSNDSKLEVSKASVTEILQPTPATKA